MGEQAQRAGEPQEVREAAGPAGDAFSPRPGPLSNRRSAPVLSQDRQLLAQSLSHFRATSAPYTMPSKKWLSIQEIAPLFHRPIVDVACALLYIERPYHMQALWSLNASPDPTLCSARSDAWRLHDGAQEGL